MSKDEDHGSGFLGTLRGSIDIPQMKKEHDDIATARSVSPFPSLSQSYPHKSSGFGGPVDNVGVSDWSTFLAGARGRSKTEVWRDQKPVTDGYLSRFGSDSGESLPRNDLGGRFSESDKLSIEDSSDVMSNLTEKLEGMPLGPYHRPQLGMHHFPGPYDLVSIGFDNRWTAFGNPFPPTDTAVDSKAIEHRRSALYAEPRCTWSGQLPSRPYKNPTYSPKVFLGGVPWDITTEGLTEAFQQFGQIRVVYANDKMGERRAPHLGGQSPKQGYLYVVFESDKRIKELLAACTHDYSNGGKYYYNISSRRMRSKEVQVIPWVISDSNFVRCPSQRLDPSKTVFVGALHGMLTAEGLAHVCNDLFGGVAYVGIDTDKFKYPIGSGRVTFNNQKSYMKAVAAAFVDIKATRFTKKIQIDPYLENSLCSSCNMQPGPIFCRDTACFRYFCRSCWRWTHSTDDLQNHKPIMRNRRD